MRMRNMETNGAYTYQAAAKGEIGAQELIDDAAHGNVFAKFLMGQ